MAVGKPVIFSGKAYNNFVLDSNCGISVEPENEIQIVEAIRKMYGMTKGELEEMGKNGRKYVEENFDIPILADKMEKIILEVLGE